MALQERLSTLFASGLTALLLAAAWVAPVLADLDGDGFDGDELILPALIVAAVVAVGMVAWRARRAGRGAE
jgi:peptidoglycan/LPS O-acetylase OafA/YrhL